MEWASRIWPSSSWRYSDRAPWSTPGTPRLHRRAVLARLEPVAAGLDADEVGGRCRGTRRRCPSRSNRRRRTRPRGRGRRRRGSRGTARALRRPRRAGTRAPSTGTGAGRRPNRCSSACSRTVATQSRSASLIASLSVPLPPVTGTTSAPRSFMRNTLSAWRSTSTAPMNTRQSRPNSAAAVAVATPCWPAPVSAMTRCLPMRRVSSAWPSTLLILCDPVWVRSSRLSSTRTPEALARGCGTR